MNIKKWFAARGLKFVIQRASKLYGRYSFSPKKSTRRIEDSMRILAKFGCSPTFFTPGNVVERYPHFLQNLQSEGAEIAVHSYQHIDLRAVPVEEAVNQLKKALQVYEAHGIENRGFRCPYLSCSPELLNALPAGMFDYSSNQAIWVGVPALDRAVDQNIIFDTLRKFYNPLPSTETISSPWVRPNLFEIPVCVPDDLQLHDGINLQPAGIAEVWEEMLSQMHKKGELYNLIFHPELSSVCGESFAEMLRQADSLRPVIWKARLRDISDWWKEKSHFTMELCEDKTSLQVSFLCTPRATILARGLDRFGSWAHWDGAYYQVKERTIQLPPGIRPFVGLESNTAPEIEDFLKQQGYLVDTSESASRCSVYISCEKTNQLGCTPQLVQFIENMKTPLLRYGRWPNGAKSAMSITGDLDAITLMDYASRLVNYRK